MTTTIQRAAQSRRAATPATTVSPASKHLQSLIKTMEPGIKAALPSVVTPERFTRIALSTVSNNPKLAECNAMSFIAALMQAAQLGLEPNTPLGQAYLIPYKNHGKPEVQFQLGYKGLIELAYRSGIKSIQAQVVYQNDIFAVEYGTDNHLMFKPKLDGDRGEPLCVWAMFKTKDDGFGFEVMSIADIRKHAQRYSKSYSNGPWQTNFEEMAKKTVLKKVLKYAPISVEFQRGLSADETIKTDLSDDMLLIPDITSETSETGMDRNPDEKLETHQEAEPAPEQIEPQE